MHINMKKKLNMVLCMNNHMWVNAHLYDDDFSYGFSTWIIMCESMHIIEIMTKPSWNPTIK